MARKGRRQLSEDSDREFERKMILFEEGPTTTNFDQLVEQGIELPAPDAIPDSQIRAKLWETIDALVRVRVFLDHTNHLSDRELYSKLWHEVLREETAAIDEIGFWSHVSLVRPDVEPDLTVYLKYYLDEQGRLDWAKDFPEDPMPDREELPYDRDRYLPKPDRRRTR